MEMSLSCNIVEQLTLTAVDDKLNNIHVIFIAIDVHYIRQIQVLTNLAFINHCTIFINLVPACRLPSIKLYLRED